VAESEPVDLLIVGGGVTGTAIARDAAGRGLRVALAEQDDLAQLTSGAGSKLIHGGLLLNDHLKRDRLPKSRRIDLVRNPAGLPLKEKYRTGLTFTDARIEAARLVVLNALDAAEHGAVILTRTRCSDVRRANGLWYARLEPRPDGLPNLLRARALVNATGPWVARFLTLAAGLPAAMRVRLVKSSHIIVPKLFDHDSPYLLPHTDRRVLFALPYEQNYTLVGTTEIDFAGDPASVTCTADEVAYLCSALDRYFKRPLEPASVLWSHAAVMPLADAGMAGGPARAANDVLDLDRGRGDEPPALSVFGGMTTSRSRAEQALAKLRPILGFKASGWTARAPLPGGDLPDADFGAFLERFRAERRWLPDKLARRYARAYGTRAYRLLDGAVSLDGLGEHLGGGLYEAEALYLLRHEWAVSDEDILFRRSKLGLHVSEETAARLRARLGQSEALRTTRTSA
jgi:glycerol-3-phosphate dehydrogenase